MAQIKFENVDVDFPILQNEHRSIKKALISSVTGGYIVSAARNVPVVRGLSNANFEIGSGERVGLVGWNGAGKTTLLRTMAGIYEPARGNIHISGQIVSLLDTGLQSELTGYENIRLRGLMIGLDEKQIKELTEEVEDFSDLGAFMSMPVRVYSSGMSMRLSFAIATIGKPEILLMDEWIMAGDAGFLMKAKSRMQRFVSDARIIVVASHSENIIRQNCSRALLLTKGVIEADGSTEDVLRHYNELISAAG